MAISYNDWKSQYEALDSAGKMKYENLAKNSELWKQYMNQYLSESKSNVNSTPTKTNTNTTPTPTPTKTNNNTGSNTSTTNQNNNNTSVNTQASLNSWTSQWIQWSGNTPIYNQIQPNQVKQKTTASNAYVSPLAKQWDSLSYEQQQEKLNQTPALRQAVTNLWLKIKEQNTWNWTTTVNQWNQDTTSWNDNTTPQNQQMWEWDYQDNSQARMDQIANNLRNYTQTHPELFQSPEAFENFFIKWKWRSQDQIDYLWKYYSDYNKYKQYDTLSSDQIGRWLVDWTIPNDYLDWLKSYDPAKYMWVGTAMTEREDQLKNEWYLEELIADNGMWWNSKEYTWATKYAIENWLFVDKNGDWIDDWLYVEPSEEEKQLWEQDTSYEAERLKLTNAMKDLQSDLTEQYPDADLSTIMLLTSDRGNKIQKALDTLNVSQTKVQWSIKYLQSERDAQMKARQNTITNLQKAYGMYYDYSPEWIAELAQAQYAASNYTLDQADNWTDAQKQMALKSVLDGYYSKYWDIIERSEQQVIWDVMRLAKEKWISLNDALEENFLQYLRDKPWFKQLNTITTNNPDITRIGTDSNGNPVYWYWQNWQLISTQDIVWTGTWTKRTERNNNPTAMTTDVAKSLGWVEWVDYTVWDSFTTEDGKTLYTAKLIGDPIEKTIELLDNAAQTWRWAFYTKWWAKRWNHTAMSDAQWLALSPEEKQAVVLQMLQREWWDITKMAYYNWAWVNWEWYNPDLVSLFDEFNTVWDDQLNQKRFRENNKWVLDKYWIDVDEFKKQYKEWYAVTTKDAFSDVLKNLDLLIEATWPDFSIDEETAAMLWVWDVWTAYDLIKQNATVNWLADAKARWLKLWVLSDSDVRMIAKASSSFNYTNSDKKWNRELMDFRNQILSKNKYLAQEYANKSTYSPNTTFSYDPNTNKITVTKWTTTAQTKWTNNKKDIKNLWK